MTCGCRSPVSPTAPTRPSFAATLRAERFSLLSYRDGLLIAVESVGSPTDYLAVKRALERGMTIPADSAADPSVPLKRLITRARDTRSS